MVVSPRADAKVPRMGPPTGWPTAFSPTPIHFVGHPVGGPDGGVPTSLFTCGSMQGVFAEETLMRCQQDRQGGGRRSE